MSIKKNKVFILILLLLIVLNYCTPKNSSNNFVSAKCDTTLNLDTPFFSRFNIINRYGKFNPAVKFIQFDTKKAGLKDYINGYDSIAIRLWYQYSGPESEIIEIRKHCTGWVADFLTIRREARQNDSIVVNIVSKRNGQDPKSGWANFTKKLFELNVTTLTDFSEIAGYNAANDGQSVDVEISTNKYYKIYTYLGPKTKPEIKEARNLEEIMELIETEFGIKRKMKI